MSADMEKIYENIEKFYENFRRDNVKSSISIEYITLNVHFR